MFHIGASFVFELVPNFALPISTRLASQSAAAYRVRGFLPGFRDKGRSSHGIITVNGVFVFLFAHVYSVVINRIVPIHTERVLKLANRELLGSEKSNQPCRYLSPSPFDILTISPDSNSDATEIVNKAT